VSTIEPYPHLHGQWAAAEDTTSGRRVRLSRRDCAACANERAPRHPESSTSDNQAGESTIELRSHLSALLRNALDYAERGWAVFPVRPNDKPPAFPDHGPDRCTGRDLRCRRAGEHVGWEQRATTDPDRIRSAWGSVPLVTRDDKGAYSLFRYAP